MTENYRRYDVIIDKMARLVAERLQVQQAAPDRDSLVDEAIRLGVLNENQREPTRRLLENAPEETRELLDDMGMATARQAAEVFGWDSPTSRSRSSSDDDPEREQIAELLGIKPAEVI